MKLKHRWSLGCVSIILLFSVLGCQSRKDVYLIPKGFSGWFIVVFSKVDWPALSTTSEIDLYQFETNKLLITSSGLKEGESRAEYYYQDGTTRVRLLSTPSGGGGQVWGRRTFSLNDQGQESLIGECFYIGTEANFQRAGEEEFRELVAAARIKLGKR